MIVIFFKTKYTLPMIITEAQVTDFDEIWSIFSAVIKTGDTYVYSPNTLKEQAFEIWMKAPKATFVLRSELNNQLLGTYYIKQNRPDLGSHICRCGYMVSPAVRRQGIGELMCQHSLEQAKLLGFRGMQLGYVVSTNTASVNLWLKMGFQNIGTVPKAFQHQHLGDVDVYIMHKSLTD